MYRRSDYLIPWTFQAGGQKSQKNTSIYVHKHGNFVLIFPFSVCNNDGKTACSIGRNYCPHTPNNRHDYIMLLLQVQNMAKSRNDCLSMNALLELCTSDITFSSIWHGFNECLHGPASLCMICFFLSCNLNCIPVSVLVALPHIANIDA